jgi:hypothetical protein
MAEQTVPLPPTPASTAEKPAGPAAFLAAAKQIGFGRGGGDRNCIPHF